MKTGVPKPLTTADLQAVLGSAGELADGVVFPLPPFDATSERAAIDSFVSLALPDLGRILDSEAPLGLLAHVPRPHAQEQRLADEAGDLLADLGGHLDGQLPGGVDLGGR